MTLTIRVTVVKSLGKDDRGYEQSEDVAKFSAEAYDSEVWEVYRNAVAALTPEADATRPEPNHD